MVLPAGEGSHVEGMGRRRPRWVTHRRSPTGEDRLKQMRVETPRIDCTGLVSPNARGCTDFLCSFGIISIVGGRAPTDP